jgi:TonB family protein
LAALIWTVGNMLDRPVAAEQSVFFIPPPPRPAPPTTRGSGGGMMAMLSLSYFSEMGAGNGAGSAADKTTLRAGQRSPVRDMGGAQTGADTTDSAGDNVYTSFEVDNVVQISSGSTVPEYPPDLLKRRVQGVVVVRFVVDTTGAADVQSLEILDSTDPQFAASVLAALPHMRFAPARLNGKRVRQLVEQPFRFNVKMPASSPTDSAA